ncbi:MAG: amino acid adenylation domain-containing protein [Pseudobacteriovorax sp.]|nr:amino acid adenylation domain-containing protein [Pseudobacteriovorax sp.]
MTDSWKKINFNPLEDGVLLEKARDLSTLEHEIWSAQMFSANAHKSLNEIFAMKINGNLDIAKLKKAIESVVQQAECLRSVLNAQGDLLCVLPTIHPNIHERTWEGDEDQLKNLLGDIASQAFDSHKGPLFRYDIIKASDKEVILQQVTHHLIADGWTCTKLMEFIGQAYIDPKWTIQRAQGMSNTLLQPKKETIQFWKEHLDGDFQSIGLARQKPTIERSFEAKRIDFSIANSDFDLLKETAKKSNATLMSYLLSCFQMTCSHICHQNTLSVGVPFAHQLLSSNPNMLGHWTSLLPIKATIDPHTSLQDLIRSTKRNLINASENADISIGDIVRHLEVPRQKDSMPIVNIAFNFDPNFQVAMGDLSNEIFSVPKKFETYEMFICAIQYQDRIDFEFSYDESLYKTSVVQKLIDTFANIITKSHNNVQLSRNHLKPVDGLDLVHKPIAVPPQDSNLEAIQNTARSPKGEVIANIWKEALGIETIENDDDFFLLGGHSLLAAKIIAKVNKALELNLRVNDILRHSELGIFIESSLGEEAPAPCEKATVSRSVDLVTPLQRQMITTEKMFPKSKQGLHELPSAWHIRGPLNIELFKRSFASIVEKHAIMRSNYSVDHEGNFAVTYREDVQHALEVINLINQTDAETLAMTEIKSHKSRWQLENDQLFVAKVFLLSNQHSIFFFSAHHIIWDGWSFDLLLEDLAKAYQNDGKLEIPTSSFQDFAAFDSQVDRTKALAHWQSRLTPLPDPLELPVDHSRPARFTFEGEHYLFQIPHELTSEIDQFCRNQRTTAFTLLLTAYTILLETYSRQSDMIVAIPTRRRACQEFEEIIGPFVTNLPVRIQFDPNSSIEDLLVKINGIILEDLEYDDIAIDDLLSTLKIHRNESRNQLFTSMFSFQDVRNRPLSLGPLTMDQIFIPHSAVSTDHLLWMKRDEKGFSGGIDYYKGILEPSTIQSMSRCLIKIIRNVVADKKQIIASLDLSDGKLDMRSMHQPSESWLDLYRQAITKFSEQEAIQYGGDILTYSEFDQKVSQTTAFLIDHGVAPGDFIGICLERGIDLIVTMMAVLKTGAAYIPLDPNYPKDRLTYMTEQSRMKLLLAKNTPSFETNAPIVLLNISDNPISNIMTSEPNPSNPAYVIYTSGSTGKPKGVVISHGALVNFVKNANLFFNIGPSDRLLAITTISFDISVLEIFLTLSVGGKIILGKAEDSMDGGRLIDLLDKQDITWMQATPSTWTMLLQSNWKGKSNLNAITGGEPLSLELAKQLVNRTKVLWNAYGPTEATVWASLAHIQRDSPRIHIGKPIDNYDFKILDDNLNEVPQGAPGILHIAGPSLAEGYLHREDLTEERFLQHPLTGSRIYNTGDLVRISGHEELEFIGRKDSQVKVRGFRIELGEIESNILSHPEVDTSVVIVREDSPGDQRLVAYINGSNKNLRLGTLNKYLTEKLPRYMLPNQLVYLEHFPLTGSGKIDRKSLPRPEIHKSHEVKFNEIIKLTSNEKKIASLWKDLVGVDEIKPEDNFFSIGGHSIAALRLIAALDEKYGYKIEVRDLMTASLQGIASKFDDVGLVTIEKPAEISKEKTSFWKRFLGNKS